MIQLLTAITYLFKDLLAVAALFMIFRYVLLDDIRINKVRALFIGSSFFAISFGGVFLLSRFTESYDIVLDFLSDVMYVLAIKLLDKKRKVGGIIWSVLLCISTVDMVYSLISTLIPIGILSEFCVNILLYLLFILLIYLYAIRSEINFLPGIFSEIPKWIFVVILLFELSCYYKEFGLSSQWYQWLYIVSSILVIACFAFLVLKIFYMSNRQSLILSQMSEQKEYSENKLKTDEEIRRFRHDYKNHMIVVNAFLENGKPEKAKEYLESVNLSMFSAEYSLKTGNFVADAILNVKQSIALADNIIIDYNGFIPPVGVRDEDLSTIISNLIDNAIEASKKIKGEKYINVEADIMGKFLVISVSNPVAPGSVNSDLSTSKKDKRNHGIGLNNVKRVVSRYDGVIVTEFDKDTFIVDVRLKLNTASNPLQ